MYKPSLFQEIRRDRKKEYVDKKKKEYMLLERKQGITPEHHTIFTRKVTHFSLL